MPPLFTFSSLVLIPLYSIIGAFNIFSSKSPQVHVLVLLKHHSSSKKISFLFLSISSPKARRSSSKPY